VHALRWPKSDTSFDGQQETKHALGAKIFLFHSATGRESLAPDSAFFDRFHPSLPLARRTLCKNFSAVHDVTAHAIAIEVDAHRVRFSFARCAFRHEPTPQ
jgi:hypothetical protein